MPKVLIEFELPDAPTEYRKFTKPSGKLVTALRELIQEGDEEDALVWLSNNVLDIIVADTYDADPQT